MQKNKIDVVKAVCNSAVKKLAVLGLMVAVGGHCVACAAPPNGRRVSDEEELYFKFCRYQNEVNNYNRQRKKLKEMRRNLDELVGKKKECCMGAHESDICKLEEKRELLQKEYKGLFSDMSERFKRISALETELADVSEKKLRESANRVFERRSTMLSALRCEYNQLRNDIAEAQGMYKQLDNEETRLRVRARQSLVEASERQEAVFEEIGTLEVQVEELAGRYGFEPLSQEQFQQAGQAYHSILESVIRDMTDHLTSIEQQQGQQRRSLFASLNPFNWFK